jgi:mannose-1-phosphate guanylyltransferase
MGLHTVLNPKDSGLVTLDAEGRIAAFEEKPQHSSGNLAFAGLLLARPSLIRYLPHQPVLDFGHDVFPRLTGKMWGYIMKGYVLDIGTPARLAQAQETWPGFQHSDGQEHV